MTFPVEMVIFHSYVQLQEGTLYAFCQSAALQQELSRGQKALEGLRKMWISGSKVEAPETI